MIEGTVDSLSKWTKFHAFFLSRSLGCLSDESLYTHKLELYSQGAGGGRKRRGGGNGNGRGEEEGDIRFSLLGSMA